MLTTPSDKSLASLNGRWLIFAKDRLLVPEETEMPLNDANWSSLPFLHHYREQVFELPPLGEPREPQEPLYLVDLGGEFIEHTGWKSISLRQALINCKESAFSTLGRAWQYVHFLRTHRFCGQCAGHTKRIQWEMAVQCDSCGHRSYPRISPCIIVAIYRDDEILLAKGVRHRESNMYSTLAGFVESGESLEEAVHREVYEEVGVRVSDLSYFGSQPWPFPHSLMVGYLAKYESGEIRLQENEIDDAQWFSLDALPNIPPRFSIAGQLIAEVINQQRK